MACIKSSALLRGPEEIRREARPYLQPGGEGGDGLSPGYLRQGKAIQLYVSFLALLIGPDKGR